MTADPCDLDEPTRTGRSARPWSSEPTTSYRTAGLDEAAELLAEAQAEQRQQARRFVRMGLGIGAIGAASAVAFGAICPVCVVAAPALVTIGLVQHARARRHR